MENQIHTFVIISSIVFAVFFLIALYLVVKLILNSAKLHRSELELQNHTEKLSVLVEERTRQLEESQKNFQSLYEQHLEILERSPAGIIRLDKKLNITYLNIEMKDILHKINAPKLLTTMNIKDIPQFNSAGFKTFFHNLLNGHEFATDPLLLKSDSESKYVILKGVPSMEGSIFNGAIVLVNDITLMKSAEAEIKRNLKEKNSLLKEVHHRVKNNMQVIISMMKLQKDLILDPRALELTINSINRVRSMALVHDRLYKANNLSCIDFDDYTRGLAMQLYHTYNINSSLVKFEKHIDDVSLNINTAVPCGLIVNELLSNALKHGFKDKQEGTITISLINETQEYILTIHNDGAPMPAEFDLNKPTGLGLQLVQSLTEQLHGNLEYDGSNGTLFKLSFVESPLNTYKEL